MMTMINSTDNVIGIIINIIITIVIIIIIINIIIIIIRFIVQSQTKSSTNCIKTLIDVLRLRPRAWLLFFLFFSLLLHSLYLQVSSFHIQYILYCFWFLFLFFSSCYSSFICLPVVLYPVPCQ